LLILAGIFSGGCQFDGRMGPISNKNSRVVLELDDATTNLDVPPDGSQVLLVDGGDCTLSWKAHGWWTVTFAGGEPITLDRFRNVSAASDDVMFARVFETGPGGFVGLAIPACAAKEISAGGCGAPAAARAARRMLAATYRLVGADRHRITCA
jgi:hypothetical protein